jgi:hypothetical protein
MKKLTPSQRATTRKAEHEAKAMQRTIANTAKGRRVKAQQAKNDKKGKK